MDWLAIAKQLPAERSVKAHCCGSGKSMIVSNGRKGFSSHCFRCGERNWQPHGQFSIEMLAKRKAEAALVADKSVELPRDFTTDIPTHAAVWLYRYGVGPDLIEAYGFGYSPYVDRVIMPVKFQDRYIGYVARRIGKDGPKYIEKLEAPGIFVSSDDCVLPSANARYRCAGIDAVLVEDIVSAIRVGCGNKAVALLGTGLLSEQLHALHQLGIQGRISVWLDGDRAGKLGARKIVRALKLQGSEVKRVKTERDPKTYSNREIAEILCST